MQVPKNLIALRVGQANVASCKIYPFKNCYTWIYSFHSRQFTFLTVGSLLSSEQDVVTCPPEIASQHLPYLFPVLQPHHGVKYRRGRVAGVVQYTRFYPPQWAPHGLKWQGGGEYIHL